MTFDLQNLGGTNPVQSSVLYGSRKVTAIPAVDESYFGAESGAITLCPCSLLSCLLIHVAVPIQSMGRDSTVSLQVGYGWRRGRC